jgi:hypothetical protein
VLVGHTCILLPAACRSIGVSMTHAFREGFAPALVSAAPAFALAAALRPYVLHASVPTLMLAGLLVGVTYLAAALLLGLTRRTRDRYFAQVRRLVVLWS